MLAILGTQLRAGSAVNFTWVGAPAAYTPPAGNAVNFAWSPAIGGGAVQAAGALDFTGAGAASHGVAAQAAGALDFTGAGAAAHGAAAQAAGALDFTGACAALHLRYEVRGEVRLGGVLVNRRVRCSKRATGELMGQADTVAGRYRVHAGFDGAEVYVTAIDLADGATDWIPPTANRLVPVLADDVA